MKKTVKFVILLLTIAMALSFTACEKEPENMENWSLPGVAEEIKFNGEKVMFPMSLDDFGEGYTISEENLCEFSQGESMKVSEINCDGSAFVSVMMNAYNNKEINSSRPISFYDFCNYTIIDNADGKFNFPNQTIPPDISINGLNFSSTADDVKKVMGEPKIIDGVEQFYFTYEELNQGIYFSFNKDGKMTAITIYFNPEILYASDFN